MTKCDDVDSCGRAGITFNRLIVIAVLLAAFLFRFAELGLKPPHADEGVNGHFVNRIWHDGFFTYSPDNYHGPLLFYLFQLSEKVFGHGVHSFRIVTSLFSFLTVFLILRSGDLLGRKAAIAAGIAAAFSPGMIFFGRSAIHEPVFVFFQLLWISGFVHFLLRKDSTSLIFFLAGVTGSFLLKETSLIFAAALFISWLWTKYSANLRREVEKFPGPPDMPLNYSLFLKSLISAITVWLLLYTGFFNNWKGAADFFNALMPWLKTGVGGSPHDKPFYYWIDLMRRYEWPALAGLIVALPGLFSRSWRMRFFSSLAFTNLLIYSLISYKTPWCSISIVWPFFMTAGIYAEKALSRISEKERSFFSDFSYGKAIIFFAALLLIMQSVLSGYRLNFRDYVNSSEPYVYVQTKKDYKLVEEILSQKFRSSPLFRNMRVELNLEESWPYPWFLSRFPNAVYGNKESPLKPNADVIFAEMSSRGEELKDLYLRRKIEIRDAREPVYLYLKKSTFSDIRLPGFGPVNSGTE